MSSIDRPDLDETARRFAVDPRNHVVLEASAGTGKTTVLVQRYVNLLRGGVEPANILAITFTRKAATEMRERIIRELRAAAALSQADRVRWLALRDRLSDISISTIDAFCLSLLREFPLEADLDPGFDMADETEVPRLVEEALDKSMRIFTALARSEGDIALVIAQLGVSRTRAGLASLLERRIVAWEALDRFLVRGPRDLSAARVCETAAAGLLQVLQRAPGGIDGLLADGPSNHPRYQLFVRAIRRLEARDWTTEAQVRTLLDRISLHFLTQDGSARKGNAIHPYNASHYPTEAGSRRHRGAVVQLAPEVERVIRRFARELNAILARGIRRMFAVAQEQYRRTLESRSALDFSDVLERALVLLRRMDEFSQSRFRLESRYHHVLVDEFQDTSRAQWELVSLLVQSWGEGMGLASNPSIFIVGDRKQSIYRFRDAEVAVLQEAGRYIEGLRPGNDARRSISRSFRAVPELLEFVNEVCGEMGVGATRPDSFTYTDTDRFPPAPPRDEIRGPVLGIAVADTPEACAGSVAVEIERILRDEVVRDRKTGVARQARPGDIAILFRSRTSHREFERELELRAIPTYVYKGLGFFDADEIKDACALLRYLAHPSSELRAAAFLRSGFVRVSDASLARLAGTLAQTIVEGAPDGVELDPEDVRVLAALRQHLPGWLALVDRLPPADLFEEMMPALAYVWEIRGRRHVQAWENLKKMRGLIRRIQNRGYATLARIADHVDALSAGDESNAVLEAVDAVNLMTVHASKGLEFPIVFVVNMARGASGIPRPVRVVVDGEGGDPSVSIGPFASDVDDVERDRELHESRRLLYVAMTRARDRLYLASALKDGVLAPGRGGLAEVLPASLRTVFAEAGRAASEEIEWMAPSGRLFGWRVCQPARAASPSDGQTIEPEVPDLMAPLEPDGVVPRLTVSQWLARREPSIRPGGGDRRTDAIVGILVHRLFHAEHRQLPAKLGVSSSRPGQPSLFDAPVAEVDDRLIQRVAGLLTSTERALIENREEVVGRAARAWVGLRHRPDVTALMRADEVYSEVPVSMLIEDSGGPAYLRGTIDCLLLTGRHVTVLEFKTGRPQASHEEQLALYVRAARALFPGHAIEGCLIYAS
jgi:ATP-dependent helicase/nuclease subunit A